MKLIQQQIPNTVKTVWVRSDTADLVAFYSIIHQCEYGHIKFLNQPQIIIDAGAEIGLASIWFSLQFPNAKIYALEPALDNFNVLKKNAESYPNIIPVHGALMANEGNASVYDPGLGVLGYRVQMVTSGSKDAVTAYSLSSLCRQYGISKIDLLKVDIEGAEKEVFAKSADWLKNVSSVVIELHERLSEGCNKSVFEAVKPYFEYEWFGGENVYFARKGVAEPVIPQCYKTENPEPLPIDRIWRTEELLVKEQLRVQAVNDECNKLHLAYQSQINSQNEQLQKMQAHINELTEQLKIEQSELGNLSNQLQNEQLQKMQAHIDELSEQLKNKQSESENLSNQLQKVQLETKRVAEELCSANEYNQALIEQLRTKTEENYALSEKVCSLLEEKNSSDEQMVFLQAYENQLKIELEDCHIKINELNSQADKIKAENQIQLERIENLNDGLNLSRAEARQWAAQYSVISNSQIWKMTKPLRVILDIMKKIPGVSLLHKALKYLKAHGVRATWRKTKEYIGSKFRKPYDFNAPVYTLSELVERANALGCKTFNLESIAGSALLDANKKPVLMVSHELNLTGAPVALGYFAKEAKRQGYMPIIISPRDGLLREQLGTEGLPIIVYDNLFESDFVSKCASVFQTIVVCTNVGAPIISQLNGADSNVVWWIHEAEASYHPGAVVLMPEHLEDNIEVYCGGPYAEKVLKKYRPDYLVNQLLYYVPDYTVENQQISDFALDNPEHRTVFVIAGMQEHRKGQDVVVRAIRLLPKHLIDQSLFVFVGRTYYPPIWEDISTICEEYPNAVRYIEELGRNDYLSLYSQTDCLICASRDDPMPIVVAEAMLYSKIIICSENAGSAELLEPMNAALIYRNNDPWELSRCIECVCVNKDTDTLSGLKERARNVYESYFSNEAFSNSVSEILSKQCQYKKEYTPFDGKVSVVIPTYNAGDDMPVMLKLLNHQTGIGQIEIIVIDSGSKDGTAEYAEAMGAKVHRISQAEFSHSYARNLGAESATGEYLLFMTQDAIPDGEDWICRLMQPVMNSGAIAVSCREKFKPGCDLFGQISIWNHSQYMGILQTDRLLKLPTKATYDSLRKNAQLNDVTCLINKEVFLKFKYRGDYAEDLDLGLRLIKDGYTLALLSKVQVNHSHTRTPLYHMKRALVDISTLKDIMPDMPYEKMPAQTAANRIISSYCILNMYLKAATEQDFKGTMDSFIEWSENTLKLCNDYVKHLNISEYPLVIKKDSAFVDHNVTAFVENLYEAYKHKLVPDLASVDSLKHFLIYTIPKYLTFSGTDFSEETKLQILDSLPKYLATIFGGLLAYYTLSFPGEKSELSEMIKDYRAGI